MKCSICLRTEEISCEADNSVHKGKQKEIQSLQQQINLQRIKYNQALERNFGKTANQNIKQTQNVNIGKNQQNPMSELISKIAVKQNTLAQIKRLKLKITEKKCLIEQHKKQRNQKLITLQNAQKHLNTIKAQTLQKSQQNIVKIQQDIKVRTQELKNSNKKVKKHFKQTFGKDLASILSIHRMFRLRESEKLFQIKKKDELDFSNYQKMAQSFYEIENIEEIITKAKSSQKGIHVLYQNLILFQIVQKIFKLWFPYPIESKINFGQSRFIGKHQNIRICGRKIIDYSKTEQNSNIIVQYFDQSIREPIRSQETVKVEEQAFQDIKPEFDETIQFNKRIYALSKDFMNFMQMNVELVSRKFGIRRRPLVFFESELMNAIQKEFLWRMVLVEQRNNKPCPSHYYVSGYGSMLKELKVSKVIDSLENMHSMKMTQEYVESNKTIPEVVESEDQGQKRYVEKEKSKSETILSSYFSSFSKVSKYFYQEQVVQELEVPSSLENVRSNSTDNDVFEPLEPEPNQ